MKTSLLLLSSLSLFACSTSQVNRQPSAIPNWLGDAPWSEVPAEVVRIILESCWNAHRKTTDETHACYARAFEQLLGDSDRPKLETLPISDLRYACHRFKSEEASAKCSTSFDKKMVELHQRSAVEQSSKTFRVKDLRAVLGGCSRYGDGKSEWAAAFGAEQVERNQKSAYCMERGYKILDRDGALRAESIPEMCSLLGSTKKSAECEASASAQLGEPSP